MSIKTLCPGCLAINRIDATRLNDKPNCGKCHQPLFLRQPLSVNDALFQRLLTKEHLPLVVDFWAGWCGPCKTFAPVFMQAAKAWEPTARFIKIDTEAARQTASHYGIRSIPTLMVFKNGKPTAQQAGALPYPQFNQWLQKNLH